MDWQTTYQQLDNAALLGLLTLLGDRIEQSKRQLEGVALSMDREEKFFKQWHGKTVDLQEQGLAVPESVEMVEQTLHFHAETAPKEQQFQQGLLGYLVDLETGRKWIVEVEALRRGLLPDPADFLADAVRR